MEGTEVYLIGGTVFLCLGISLFLKKFISHSPINSLHEVNSNQRKLGLLERWYTASHENNILYGFGLCLQLEGELSTSSILTGLKKVMKIQPLLRVTIVDD